MVLIKNYISFKYIVFLSFLSATLLLGYKKYKSGYVNMLTEEEIRKYGTARG